MKHKVEIEAPEQFPTVGERFRFMLFARKGNKLPSIRLFILTVIIDTCRKWHERLLLEHFHGFDCTCKLCSNVR